MLTINKKLCELNGNLRGHNFESEHKKMNLIPKIMLFLSVLDCIRIVILSRSKNIKRSKFQCKDTVFPEKPKSL